MGPISIEWYKDRGLTRKVSEVLREGRIVYPKGLGPGDVWEYDEITTHYAGGRIDIYGVPDEHYPLEYGLRVMHGEDWNALSDWLYELTTTELWEYDMLISIFEGEVLNGREIRWWKDED
jgi:hypothetical protein